MCVCQCATVAAKTVQIWKRGWRVSKQTGRRRRRKQQKQKTNLAERARMGFSNIWPSREAEKRKKKKNNEASLLVDPVNGARHQQQQRP